MNIDINDQELNELYQTYWKVHAQMLEDHSSAAVAGVLIAQALTIYKTVLNETEFNKMLDSISESRDRVQALDISKGLLH